MRALIFVLSVLAILTSAHAAKAGLITTPRVVSASVDTATVTDEATRETESQIGLTKAKRREVQRQLTRLGFGTKVNGKFDDSTRAAIMLWQQERSYPTTGFLNSVQHKALNDESVAAVEASKSDHQNRRGGGHARYSRSVGGPIGVIGGVVGGVVGGLFRR
jgi:peptidoglycan hydrolase-like protein with peptidoglycan-binding domain